MKVAIVVLALVVSVIADQPYSTTGPKSYGETPKEYIEVSSSPRPYEFGYKVHDEETYSNYQRQEVSDGKSVRGSYHVHLPDGRVQTVTYTAGKDGNNVEVSYEGEAQYPEYVPPKESAKIYAPVYRTPPDYAKSDDYASAPVYNARDIKQY